MKETSHRFLKIATICLGLTISFSLNGCAITCVFEPAPLDATIVSPNKTYEIRLKEQIELKNNFWSCYGDHNVKMSVAKNLQPFISDEVIYSGDSLDGRFGELNGFWLSENVLSLYGKPNGFGIYDEIKIINQTEKVVQFIEIGGGGKFIVFDLEPKEQVSLQTNSQTTKSRGLSWISCRFKFADGEKRFDVGTNFEAGDKDISITHYTISIKDLDAEIESTDFKQYKSGSNKVSIPTQTPVGENKLR